MQYDITVIGGGPGGYVAALRAAQFGKRVCLIEGGQLGGVCLNQGCIPTKTLLQTVSVLRTVQTAEQFAVKGISSEALKVDLTALRKRKGQVVAQLTGGVAALLKRSGVEVITGTASLVEPNTAAVGDREITSERFILATGSHPVVPASIALDPETEVMTSAQALELRQVPGKLGVIGGGVIGIELAYLYAALGAEVQVFEAADQILPMMDETIAAMARQELTRQGILFHTGVSVTQVRRGEITYRRGEKADSWRGDEVLLAVGRAPNTTGLGLEKLGIRVERGAVVTDESLRTSCPTVYAIGDVNGHLMLAHTASREAHAAVEHICTGQTQPIRYDTIASCVYTQPELASVGLTEGQAKAQKLDVSIGYMPLGANGKALAQGQPAGGVKVIVDRQTGEVYGAHIMAPHATDLIAELGAAMTLEATAESMVGVVHPHPTISECVHEAFLSALGRAIHI